MECTNIAEQLCQVPIFKLVRLLRTSYPKLAEIKEGKVSIWSRYKYLAVDRIASSGHTDGRYE